MCLTQKKEGLEPTTFESHLKRLTEYFTVKNIVILLRYSIVQLAINNTHFALPDRNRYISSRFDVLSVFAIV